MGSCDRGGCALSSGGNWCHRRQRYHLAILPAYLLVQATSLLGLFYVTDFRWTFARAQPSGLR
jgi:hypothetical protein